MRVVDHERTVPVDGDKGPCQGSRGNGGVNEARRSVVAEVERRQVEKVEDDDEFGPDEVRAHKEHDKRKVEEVVENKVAADAGCVVDRLLFAGEEVRNVAELEDEENDPVNVTEDGAHGKCRSVQVVLVPDTAADGEAILGLVEDIVDGDDDGQEPREEGKNLVGDDGAGAVRLAVAKGVPSIPIRHGDVVWMREVTEKKINPRM